MVENDSEGLLLYKNLRVVKKVERHKFQEILPLPILFLQKT